MTAQPPDPPPEETPGLEPGGGVRPGDTPPESGQTSGLSHREPTPPRVLPIVTIALTALAALLIAGIFVVMIFQIW
ncbi:MULTISPECIES: DUF6480 family protein [Prauserella salsuginis group]|uniref:DUF6480 family protein n=1 Tax=Prauserella salsuginis TaxID=387889 RepID=A0ABW6G9G8_9PSEU|nr:MULTISPECIES: DUF6480 family protein [Prauserella salsuginis group]MCR3721534.1 hypothetical protein [Prauserella flava]MCR3734226.1 hypothetical protein [Prauserella salsuginis]